MDRRLRQEVQEDLAPIPGAPLPLPAERERENDERHAVNGHHVGLDELGLLMEKAADITSS